MLCVCLYLIIKNINEKVFSSVLSIGRCDKNGLDRFLECAVCGRGVKLCYLHENCKAHFHIDDAAIKVSLETKKLVKTKSPTRMEAQQETKMSKPVAATRGANMATGTKVAKTEGMNAIIKNKAVMQNAYWKQKWCTAIVAKRRTRSHFAIFIHVHTLIALVSKAFINLNEHQSNLFDGRDDRNGLRNIIDGWDSEDRHEMRPALDNNADNRIAFSMKISAKNLDMYLQLKLMQYGVDVN